MPRGSAPCFWSRRPRARAAQSRAWRGQTAGSCFSPWALHPTARFPKSRPAPRGCGAPRPAWAGFRKRDPAGPASPLAVPWEAGRPTFFGRDFWPRRKGLGHRSCRGEGLWGVYPTREPPSQGAAHPSLNPPVTGCLQSNRREPLP